MTANVTNSSLIAAYGYCQDGSFLDGVDLCSSCVTLVDGQAYLANCMSPTSFIPASSNCKN